MLCKVEGGEVGAIVKLYGNVLSLHLRLGRWDRVWLCLDSVSLRGYEPSQEH